MAQVQRKNVTHKWHAMIDWMIANPSGTNAQLAEYMSMTEPSISIIKHSDGFKALMQHKMDEKTRELRQIMNGKLLSVGARALDIVSERLEEKRRVLPIKDAMEIAKPVLDALGFGARSQGPNTQVNVNTGPQVQVNHISLEELRAAQAEMQQVEARNALRPEALAYTPAQHNGHPIVDITPEPEDLSPEDKRKSEARSRLIKRKTQREKEVIRTW
jgi:hypothetical protein